MKRVLVTGANGHLGNNLVMLLAKKGYRVRASVRNIRDESKTHYLQHPNVEIVQIELMDPNSILRAAVGVDCIFHSAAPNILWAKNPKSSIIDPIIKGSEYVMSAATSLGVKNIVFTSSCSAAGVTGGPDEKITEEHWNSNASIHLIAAKMEAEKRVVRLAKNGGIRLSSILMPSVIGPRCYRHTANTENYEKLLRGRLPALPPVGFHVLDVRDAAEAHVMAYENPKAHGRYIVAGRHFTSEDLLDFIESYGNSELKGPKRVLPTWAFAPLITGDWVKNFLTGSPRLITWEVAREFFNKDQWVSTEKAERELGWKSRPFEETFQDTLDWVQDFFVDQKEPRQQYLP